MEEEEPSELRVSASRADRRRKSAVVSKESRSEFRKQNQRTEAAVEQFNSLLSGLSLLHDDSQLHWVYSLAIEAITSDEDVKVLGEALHQRWLSDPSFPLVAAKIALYFADLEMDDLKFGSMMFTVVMNDYRDRAGMRSTSRAIFTNSVHFTFQYYFAFRHRGPVFNSLVDCLFDYLNVLVDKDTTDTELLLVHRLFCYFGADLMALSFRQTQDVLIKVRHKIIDSEMKARVRGKLVELIDLSYAQFEFSALSEEQQDFYGRYHVRAPGVEARHPAAKPVDECSFPRRSRSRTAPRPSSRRESIIF